jgi:hypothetical protein
LATNTTRTPTRCWRVHGTSQPTEPQIHSGLTYLSSTFPPLSSHSTMSCSTTGSTGHTSIRTYLSGAEAAPADDLTGAGPAASSSRDIRINIMVLGGDFRLRLQGCLFRCPTQLQRNHRLLLQAKRGGARGQEVSLYVRAARFLLFAREACKPSPRRGF